LEALVWLVVLLQFNRHGLYRLPVAARGRGLPFMKRITYWPQIVLGLAFSWVR